MRDKEKLTDERIIFNLIYGTRKDLIVNHRDKPDFWIENEIHQKFGVEITQLFINESDARLKNIPHYMGELLDLKKYRHKDDKINLRIDEIEIINPSGEKTKTEAIIQRVPNRQKYLNKLASRLNEKNSLIVDYNKDLSYHNLIINDYSNCLALFKKVDFFNVLYSDNIIKLLLESDFHEIYLITTLSKNQYLFPLKRILFLSRIFFFQEILRIKYPLNQEIPDSQYFNWLGEFLLLQGFKKVKLRNTNNEFELNYLSTGYMLKEGNKIIIRDYDLHLINYSEYKDILNIGFLSQETIGIINTIQKTFVFSCSLGYKILKTTPKRESRISKNKKQ